MKSIDAETGKGFTKDDLRLGATRLYDDMTARRHNKGFTIDEVQFTIGDGMTAQRHDKGFTNDDLRSESVNYRTTR